MTGISQIAIILYPFQIFWTYVLLLPYAIPQPISVRLAHTSLIISIFLVAKPAFGNEATGRAKVKELAICCLTRDAYLDLLGSISYNGEISTLARKSLRSAERTVLH